MPSSQVEMRRGHPFHQIATLSFSLITLLVGGLVGAHAYFQQRALLLGQVSQAFERSARETRAEFAAAYLPLKAQLALLSVTIRPGRSPERHLHALARLLESSDDIASITLRDPSGAVRLILTPLRHAEARRRTAATAEAAYRLDLAGDDGNRARFFDVDLRPLGAAPVQPAAFRSEGTPSLALIHASGGATIEARLELKQISALLSRQRATPSMQMAMLDGTGRLLATSQGAWPEEGAAEAPTLASMGLPILATLATRARQDGVVTLWADGRRWEARARQTEIAPDFPVLLLMAAPRDEVLADAERMLRRTLVLILLVLGLTLPLIWWLARRLTDSLRRLAAAAEEVRAFRFTTALPASPVAEIATLAAAMREMSATIRRFLDISARMAAERDFDQLLDAIVAETITAADAGAGVVYLFDETRRLQPMAWRKLDGKVPLPPTGIDPGAIPGFAAALDRKGPCQFSLPPAHAQAGIDWLCGWFPGRNVRVLLVPLRNLAGESHGLLLLARGAEAGSYEEDLIAFIDALSGTMAVTIEKQRLLAGRKALLDGVIRMIAGAIDARSPYTSGHCRRVPELVALLADAAATHPASPYRHLPWDDNSREALHLAAWLHDCGKLLVPDYVADKAVKLETIHNRIHEIRTRFEVLKRDAEIVYWRGVAAGQDEPALRQTLERIRQDLDADFAFVAACNLGERTLDAADGARLLRIGARTWQRTIDDRIGISALEMQRKARVPPRPLPAWEHLLADRLEHLVDAEVPEIRDLPRGSRLSAPRHRLNCGELYCLSVRAGTLTEEERYLINAHVLGTIAMLSSLPFPAELASVPEVAGSHHEHLDGSGYPHGKRGEELSLAARMLAIADVFEALTASDRPYKPGMSPDEALMLMEQMARSGHLDPELFALFVAAGVPARYAEISAGQSRSRA